MPGWADVGLKAASSAMAVGGSIIQHNLQKDLINHTADINLAQWNRENAYNSPTQQMARFKAAGLNPDLIYGQSNEASGGSLVSDPGQASNPAAAYGSILNGNLNAEKISAEIDLLRAQENELNSRAGLHKAETDLTYGNLDRLGVLNELTEEQKNELKKRCELMDKQIDEIAQGILESVARTNGQELKNYAQRIQNSFLDKQLQADLDKTLSEINVNKAMAAEINERVRFAVATFGLRIEGLQLDNQTKEQQVKILKDELIAMQSRVLEGLQASESIMINEYGNKEISHSEYRIRGVERVMDDVSRWLGNVLHINLSSFSGETYSRNTSHNYSHQQQSLRIDKDLGGGIKTTKILYPRSN